MELFRYCLINPLLCLLPHLFNGTIATAGWICLMIFSHGDKDFT